MKRSRVSSVALYKLLALVGVIVLSYFLYASTRPRPLPADIFVVTPLSYGDTTLTGTVRKDAPAGTPGTFLLILTDGRPITLDIAGLDNLLGSQATVEGYLSPPATSDDFPSMRVSTLTPYLTN